MKNKVLISVIIIIMLLFQSNYASAAVIKSETSKDGIKTYYVSSPEENQIVFNMVLARRDEKFNVIYSGTDMTENPLLYLGDAVSYNYMYQNSMYNLSYGIGSYYSYSMGHTERSDGSVLAKYNVAYIVNSEKTEPVLERVHAAIIENAEKLKTDYDKVLWAYQWVIDNVFYDDTLTYYSAYDGIQDTGTVCSGYAALYCLIMNELGVDCSYVSGTVGSAEKFNHAWNIVKLNGAWYCVDPTGGDNNFDKFFLKSKETFSELEYATHESKLYENYESTGEQFSKSDYDINQESEVHPMLPSVYNVKVDILKYYTLAVGEQYQFLLDNPDGVSLLYSNSNPRVAKIKNGKIIGKRKGTTTITIYNEELNIAQSCIITVE